MFDSLEVEALSQCDGGEGLAKRPFGKLRRRRRARHAFTKAIPRPTADVTGPEAGRKLRTASAWQVRQPMYTTSKERWRHYERFLGPLEEVLAQGPARAAE